VLLVSIHNRLCYANGVPHTKGEKILAEELKKILYVEDDLDIRAVVRLALQAFGEYTLLVCSSGPEAIEKVADFGPDLFLLDVMMPGMDGPQTLTEMRKIPGLELVPAIFLTAKVQPEEIAHYEDLGALEVIAKPFDPTQLCNRIKDVWESQYF